MKKRIYILIAAAMLMTLTACGAGREQGESVEHTGYEMPKDEAEGAKTDAGAVVEPIYETETLSYSEPGKGFSFRKDMEKTQTDYAVYYFDPSIGSQERNACIEATDRALSCIDAAAPGLEVVILTPEFYDGVSVTGNRLCLPVQPWDSADYLAKVLLAGYGEWGNYGLAYGYADYLCRKAGLDSGQADSGQADSGTDSGERETDGFLPMSALELYDMNLLCFDEQFVSPEDVEAAKNNACLFVEEYLLSYSEEELLELLSASGTEEGVTQANKVLEAFYAGNGVECSLSEIRYQYGGVAFDYAAACKYASFYIEADWQDEYWEDNPMVSENFLHEDYGEVRAFIECHERQMGQYQELFGFDSYNNDLSVFFDDGMLGNSMYRGDKDIHMIHLKNIYSLMHEYIHSLMFCRFSDGESLWKTEGFARYFSYKYDAYSYDFNNNVLNSDARIWVREYIDMIGRPIDVRTDYYEGLLDILIHAYGLTTNPNSSYESGASFIGYLVNQYGEQAVIAYVCSDDEYNAEWGKSYDELVQDWNQYIEDNYSQYSTN